MKLLILGGTVFLGRHIVEAALLQEHEITLFNRGKSAPDLFPDVEKIIGDRDGGLDALHGRAWDVVIDTCGYLPRVVRASAEALVGAVKHYIFISTVSVYADFSLVGLREDDPLAQLADETTEEIGENYGGLKALCEKAVQQVFPEHHLIIRPGLIVGPYDPTDRFTYWCRRVAQGGDVLAPGKPNAQVQVIDARDLAEWTLRMAVAGSSGVYNAVGPATMLSMQEILETSKQVSGSDANIIWARADFLLEHGVAPWTDMPLWLPGEENIGMDSVDNSKAIRDGLTFRPIEQTIGDILGWDEAREGVTLRAGISREREIELITAWCSKQGNNHASRWRE